MPIRDVAPHRRRPPLQPLLHAADRRAAQNLSRQPLFARRSAGALRNRQRRCADRKRHRPRARPRCRLSQPDAAQFRKARTDCAKGVSKRRPAKPSGADAARATRLSRRWSGARSADRGDARQALARRAGAADRGHGTIERLLGGDAEHDADARTEYILRAPTPRRFRLDRHTPRRALCARNIGWTEPFEGLCAQIVADFVNNYDAKRERCWIAEMNGENVGTIMLAKENRRASPASACCWSTLRRAGSASARGSSTNASASRAAPATRKSRYGPTACLPRRATSTKRPASS